MSFAATPPGRFRLRFARLPQRGHALWAGEAGVQQLPPATGLSIISCSCRQVMAAGVTSLALGGAGNADGVLLRPDDGSGGL